MWRRSARRARDRGATLVEYLIVVGVIALFAVVGFRLLGKRLKGRTDAFAQCVSDLDCPHGAPSMNAPGAGPANDARRSGIANPTGAASGPSSPGGPAPVARMTQADADRFMDDLAHREANALRPGVLYDGETGLTYDSHGIDPATGALTGTPTPFSAASKESLDVMLLAKAINGDATARAAIAAGPNGEDATSVALDRLRRKIDSYAAFNARYPGFGGFLPWFAIAGKPGDRHITPTSDWANRVPALDNGELAWSLYAAERTLRAHGYTDLANKYKAELDLMRKNVVPIFYDPKRGTLRAEAEIVDSTATPPERNRYRSNPKNDYALDDGAEGLAMVHFADLYGDWRSARGGRDALWRKPRHEPVTFTSDRGERITVARGWRFSSHEDWAYLMLPTRDVPIANQLFENAQRVRTTFAADGGRAGLYASTHAPTNAPNPPYEDDLGIPSVATEGTRALPIYAPYATFPVALVDKRAAATWLANTAPAIGPSGLADSVSGDGAISPVVSWDGSATPIVAYGGGVVDEVRAGMKADGVYDRFVKTVQGSYAPFEGVPIEGTQLPLRDPTAGVPKTNGNVTTVSVSTPASSANRAQR